MILRTFAFQNNYNIKNEQKPNKIKGFAHILINNYYFQKSRGNRIRTRINSFGDCYSTIELCPYI